MTSSPGAYPHLAHLPRRGRSLFCLAACITLSLFPGSIRSARSEIRAALVRPEQATEAALGRLRSYRLNALALNLSEQLGPAGRYDTVKRAALYAEKRKWRLYYWIEVGRCPELADARPEWMASLQGHPEWRRLYPGAPEPKAGEVTKVYPWVPIRYEGAFEAQLARVKRLLAGRPRPAGIFLNNLQAAPSACGCGNLRCRWTPDYGPLQTAKVKSEEAAAEFVREARKLAPGAEVIPVWSPECEEREGAKEGACAGVGCFPGACWREWTRQLMPLEAGCARIGVLATFRALDAGTDPAWARAAVECFQKMPPLRGGRPVPAGRLIPVLQGWNVTRGETETQIRAAKEAGSQGFLLALSEISQDWEPRIVPLKRQ